MPPEAPTRVAFADLFDDIGTLSCRYSARAAALSGTPVEIEGYWVRPHGAHGHHLLTAHAGVCPDCSATPEPTILLCEIADDGAGPSDGPTRLAGTLEFGLEISPAGDASFLRLRGARRPG
jgi:hypothetical protein